MAAAVISVTTGVPLRAQAMARLFSEDAVGLARVGDVLVVVVVVVVVFLRGEEAIDSSSSSVQIQLGNRGRAAAV